MLARKPLFIKKNSYWPLYSCKQNLTGVFSYPVQPASSGMDKSYIDIRDLKINQIAFLLILLSFINSTRGIGLNVFLVRYANVTTIHKIIK